MQWNRRGSWDLYKRVVFTSTYKLCGCGGPSGTWCSSHVPMRPIHLSVGTQGAQGKNVDLSVDCSHAMVTVYSLWKTDLSLHVLHIYCPPKTQQANFADIFSRALEVAVRDPLVIAGDFNVPTTTYQYRRGHGYRNCGATPQQCVLLRLFANTVLCPAIVTHFGPMVGRGSRYLPPERRPWSREPGWRLTQHLRDVPGASQVPRLERLRGLASRLSKGRSGNSWCLPVLHAGNPAA